MKRSLYEKIASARKKFESLSTNEDPLDFYHFCRRVMTQIHPLSAFYFAKFFSDRNIIRFVFLHETRDNLWHRGRWWEGKEFPLGEAATSEVIKTGKFLSLGPPETREQRFLGETFGTAKPSRSAIHLPIFLPQGSEVQGVVGLFSDDVDYFPEFWIPLFEAVCSWIGVSLQWRQQGFAENLPIPLLSSSHDPIHELGLTEREMMILIMRASGVPVSLIHEALGVGRTTVHNDTQKAFSKIGLTTADRRDPLVRDRLRKLGLPLSAQDLDGRFSNLKISLDHTEPD